MPGCCASSWSISTTRHATHSAPGGRQSSVRAAYANGIDGYTDPVPGCYPSVRYAIVLVEAAVDFGFGLLFGVAVPRLHAPYQLVTLAGYFVEVVIGEIAPPFLDFTSELLPLPFKNIRVHLNLLSSTRQ